MTRPGHQQFPWRRASVLLAALLALGQAAAAGLEPAGPAAKPGAVVSRLEEEVLLFALRLDQATLSGTFPGFAVKDGVIVPLGELCRLLDLAIQTHPDRGLADGFLIDERRRFALDVLAGTVTVAGLSRPVDRSRIELHADDIYVDTRLLAEWLPLDFKVDKRAASITVVPREPLPLQQRWKRERDMGRLRQGPALKQLPRVADPYRAFEVPFVDETLRLTARSEPQGTRGFVAQGTTFATGDLLFLSTSLYSILDARDGLSEFRMTMGRRDPNGGLLGPLQATEFAFGEVLNPGLNLLTQPYAGTGALFTNFPLQRENAFDRHSFLGDLPPGWQVELYRNQALLGFQASRADGRYEFLNVPLYYGWNDFRLVFYGPQGQRREEVARFDVSESQTPAGAFQYRLLGDDPRNAGRRGQLEARYGLSRQLTSSFALSRLDLDGVRHVYSEAGVQGFWKPLSATFTAARDSQGGSVEELGIRSRIGTLSLTAKRAQLQGGFVSEVFRPVYGLVRSRTSLESSALLPSLERSWFTLDLGGAQDELAGGGTVERLFHRISTSYGGYFFSNEITRSAGHGGAAAFPATTTADLLASKFFRTFSLRGQANYLLGGGAKLNSLAFAAETPVYDPYLVRAGITRTLASGETLFQVGANKSRGAFTLGLDLSYSTRSRLIADLTLRIGIGREPRLGRMHLQALSLASQGAVSARAFLDGNGNGVLDPGEKVLEGVGFLVNGASHPRTTDARGVAFLTNLSGDLDANFAVASSSLEDPLMRPGSPGIRITPRPGHVRQADFPLVLFGEVTGTVYLRKGAATQELPGLRLELVDAAEAIVKAVRTAFDGFYDFTEIPPGNYRLRVPDAELRRYGLKAVPPRNLRILPDGTLLDGLDLVLESSSVPLPPPEGS